MTIAQETAKKTFDKYFSRKWIYYKGRKQIFMEMPKNVAKEIAIQEIESNIDLLQDINDTDMINSSISLSMISHFKEVILEIDKI